MAFVLGFSWLTMAGVVAVVAKSTDRSGLMWFLYGVLLWPVALIQALVIMNRERPGKKTGNSATGLRLDLVVDGSRRVASTEAPATEVDAQRKHRMTSWFIAAAALAGLVIYMEGATRLPFRLSPTFALGALISGQASYAVWNGFRFGRFHLGIFTARASRTNQPIQFWCLAFLHSLLAFGAVIVLLLAIYAMIHNFRIE